MNYIHKVFSLFLIGLMLVGQVKGQDYRASIQEFQNELNAEFSNPAESPLSEKEIQDFEGLPFFPIKEEYRILAKFERMGAVNPFQMKTSANTLQSYDVYGTVTFTYQGKEYSLNIYQSHKLREQEKYKDYLFLPFTDLSNGDETYGGGRYLDLKIPVGNTIEIDFNKAYNPSCAYSAGYECPIPPKENDLPIAIRAGVLKN